MWHQGIRCKGTKQAWSRLMAYRSKRYEDSSLRFAQPFRFHVASNANHRVAAFVLPEHLVHLLRRLLAGCRSTQDRNTIHVRCPSALRLEPSTLRLQYPHSQFSLWLFVWSFASWKCLERVGGIWWGNGWALDVDVRGGGKKNSSTPNPN